MTGEWEKPFTTTDMVDERRHEAATATRATTPVGRNDVMTLRIWQWEKYVHVLYFVASPLWMNMGTGGRRTGDDAGASGRRQRRVGGPIERGFVFWGAGGRRDVMVSQWASVIHPET